MTGGTATVGDALLEAACGDRHGVVGAVTHLTTTFADIPGIHHASVTGSGPEGQDLPAGGVGRDRGAAGRAAIGEALERYAAAMHPLPATRPGAGDRVLGATEFSLHDRAQRHRPDFPFAAAYAPDAALTGVTEVTSRTQWHVPRFLVGLSDPAGAGVATSNGLAAATSRTVARLGALQELVERDALATTWTHGVPGRAVALPPAYTTPVESRGGTATAFDATPAYSPHAVAIVCGQVPWRGRPRIALGAACRATWAAAAEKADLEWCQGLLFAGVQLEGGLGTELETPDDVRSFRDHATYYTRHPDQWARVPLLQGLPAETTLAGAGAPIDVPPAGHSGDDPAEALAGLVAALTGAGVRLFERDLTTPDLAQLGIRVVRMLSPDLTGIQAGHAWPYLGGRAPDLALRYPGATPACGYPNPLPHPLG